MPKPGSFFHNILIWSYERGTIPYDIICVLILAFVFLTPRACFQRKRATEPARAPYAQAGTSSNPGQAAGH